MTDEHIVPFFLGGQHVLEKASCNKCADITKKFEHNIARDLWGDARNSYNAPTRRKKERKKIITIPDATNPGKFINVKPLDYPGLFIFYKMTTAGILQGIDESIDNSNKWELIALHDTCRIESFQKIYKRNPTARFRNVPTQFAQLIAKIGYCQLLTLLDPGDFTPLILPYIIGKKQNLSYLVGSNQVIEDQHENTGYHLTSSGYGTIEKFYLISEIRLLASNSTPTYHVVVGSVSGREDVEFVISKMSQGSTPDIQLVDPPFLQSPQC